MKLSMVSASLQREQNCKGVLGAHRSLQGPGETGRVVCQEHCEVPQKESQSPSWGEK